MINMIFRLNENKILSEKDFNRNYKDFTHFCKYFNTVEDVMTWYKYNKIQWPLVEDKENLNNRSFSWPDDIIKTKIGNCWDHAIFFYYFCRRKNMPARIYRYAIFAEPVWYDNNHKYKRMDCFGHIVCICKLTTGYYICNYLGSVKDSNLFGPYESFEACAKHYSNYYDYLVKVSFLNMINEYIEYKSFTKVFYAYVDNKDLKLYDEYYNNHNITQFEFLKLEKSNLFKYDNYSIQRNIFDDLQTKFKYYLRLFGKKIFEWGS